MLVDFVVTIIFSFRASFVIIDSFPCRESEIILSLNFSRENMSGKSVKSYIISVTPSENGSSSLETDPQGIKLNIYFLFSRAIDFILKDLKSFSASIWTNFRYKKRVGRNRGVGLKEPSFTNCIDERR